ncbi:MAG TPA: response regulator [Verrucomicrobiota bacterium]|nr:response regulator [Verrucomicrobiota bacterium]HRZ35017.1 response regulator [Candidatus Paceibacterota bacterium]
MSEHEMYVAVVDDDDSFSRAISRLLRAAGMDSVVFASAEAFLRDPTHPRASCIILDIHLGGMSGLDLCRLLSSEGHVAHVIMVTAHDEPEFCQEARQIGCAAYFRKPVPGKLLLEAVHNVVNAPNP